MVDIAVTMAGAVGCFAYVLTSQRRKAKKPIYAIKGIILLFAAFIYGYALFGPDTYFIRSGWATNIVWIMFISAFFANLMTDWRKK